MKNARRRTSAFLEREDWSDVMQRRGRRPQRGSWSECSFSAFSFFLDMPLCADWIREEILHRDTPSGIMSKHAH